MEQHMEGSGQYKTHLQKYGHPSVFGFKDVINTWHAENWDPAKLMALYKRAGAQYFVALANHHDNFDNYDSAYQPWNATKVGPKRFDWRVGKGGAGQWPAFRRLHSRGACVELVRSRAGRG